MAFHWMHLILLTSVIIAIAVGDCVIRKADVPPCEHDDSFYYSKRCDVPRVYEWYQGFETACASVNKMLSTIPECDLTGKIDMITALSMRKGCITPKGKFIIKSSTVKALLNAIEEQCHRTGKHFDETVEEAGFLAGTTHQSCKNTVEKSARKKTVKKIVEQQTEERVAKAPAIRNKDDTTKQLSLESKLSDRTSCSGNYCKYDAGCDYYDSENHYRLCCPSSCLNVGVFEHACCTIEEVDLTCHYTLYWHRPYDLC